MELAVSNGGVALAAIDGTVVLGKEGNLRVRTTVGTNGFVHFARATGVAVGFVRLAAFPAAGRLVLEASFRVEFLFACGERELLPAVTAYQSFVLVHEWKPPENE